MKHFCHVVIALCLFLSVGEAVAQERDIGLGVTVGEPTGICAKVWTSADNAIDFGFGRSMGGNRVGRYLGYDNGGGRVHFHADYLWHSFQAIHSSGRFPLYYGLGGRVNSGGGYDRTLAVRSVVGIAWLLQDTPIDVFLELAPSFQLTSPSGFGIEADLGARYFF